MVDHTHLLRWGSAMAFSTGLAPIGSSVPALRVPLTSKVLASTRATPIGRHAKGPRHMARALAVCKPGPEPW